MHLVLDSMRVKQRSFTFIENRCWIIEFSWRFRSSWQIELFYCPCTSKRVFYSKRVEQYTENARLRMLDAFEVVWISRHNSEQYWKFRCNSCIWKLWNKILLARDIVYGESLKCSYPLRHIYQHSYKFRKFVLSSCEIKFSLYLDNCVARCKVSYSISLSDVISVPTSFLQNASKSLILVIEKYLRHLL